MFTEEILRKMFLVGKSSDNFWKQLSKSPNSLQFAPRSKPTRKEKELLVEQLLNPSYKTSDPHHEYLINKGKGVIRLSPILKVVDLMFLYAATKMIEDELLSDRVAFTYGGWSLGGHQRKIDDEEKLYNQFNIKYDINYNEPTISIFQVINADEDNEPISSLLPDEAAFNSAQLESLTQNASIQFQLSSIMNFSFNPKAFRKYHGDMRKIIFNFLDRDVYSHIVRLDIANFYDCIDSGVLRQKMLDATSPDKHPLVDKVVGSISEWQKFYMHDDATGIGLVQEQMGDCSRILANHYLQKYDRVAQGLLRMHGGLYVRYADDQYLLLDDSKGDVNRIAENLVSILSGHLKSLNLNFNSSKVEVISKSAYIDKQALKIWKEIELDEDDTIGEVKDRVYNFLEYVGQLNEKERSQLEKKAASLFNFALWLPWHGSNVSSSNVFKSYYLNLHFLERASSQQLRRIYSVLEENLDRLEMEMHLSDLLDSQCNNDSIFAVYSFATNCNLDVLRNKALARYFEVSKSYRQIFQSA